jgi:hypothetical protein
VTRPSQLLAARLPRSVVNRIKRLFAALLSWNLDALGILWGTDKARGHHGYTRYYARHLRKGRRSIRSVLEIGIGEYLEPESGGNSLRMWRSYFPRATVYGIDLYEKRLDGDPRIVALQADQSDPASLQRVIATCPRFDLIIDDGSHVGEHIVTSFNELFAALEPGGFYVIEDVEYSYVPKYGGGPVGTDNTAVALAKSLLDDLHMGPRAVASIHAYPGIVFIEKAPAPGPTAARARAMPELSGVLQEHRQ